MISILISVARIGYFPIKTTVVFLLTLPLAKYSEISITPTHYLIAGKTLNAEIVHRLEKSEDEQRLLALDTILVPDEVHQNMNRYNDHEFDKHIQGVLGVCQK